MSIVVHHNPDSGTSHSVLAIVEAAGYRPIVLKLLDRLPPGPVYEEDGI